MPNSTLALLLVAASCPTTAILTTSTASAASSTPFGELRAEINASPQAYGDPFYDQSTNTLHVTMAHPEALKGTPALRSSDDVDGEALGARQNVAIEVDSVKYSHEELKRVMDQISTTQPWTSDVKASLATWGIDPKADKVEVGLTQVTPAIAQEASALFGDKVELVTRSRDKSADKITKLSGLPKVVKIASQDNAKTGTSARKSFAPAAAGPPLVDSEPYIGGDRMWREFNVAGQEELEECTAGGMWSTGADAMASAGHCSQPNINWTQGYYDQPNNTLWETGHMGFAFVNAFSEGGSDSMLLDGGNYAPYVWSSANGGLQATPVTAATTVAVQGVAVCFDGSFSGTQCSGHVSIPDQCSIVEGPNPETGIPTDVTVCNQTRVTSATSIVQFGDSGGPVFLDLGTSGAAALGVISALNDNGLTGVYANRTGMMAHFVGDFVI
ncbi:hypothetical protein H4696_001088 [Amycolatopsis lexingtonensis]|uniref:Peptidase S1 domain-containing protein n=1 Tax=Amycolatopsis lexingtonensis TaxID=218822 RepID=A0ABR9HSU0_9PSEU|nr:hypothetical protein [Amycolatopsis lexingtonensis]MBE1493988.1 hypothetical protein [Amycolatopsis lexingtonensis]